MAKSQLEIGQLVLCTVTKIVGTTVFVTIDNYNKEGTITFMEIAPGRIRNIREYAFPGKKIVCKVLSINPQHIELSFRRVKVNERSEFNEQFKREKSYFALLKTILGEQTALDALKNIQENENSLFEFIESAKTLPKLLEKYVKKEHSEKILKILGEKKVKEIVLNAKFSLSSKNPNGILLVKDIIKKSIENVKQTEISYLAAGKYLIKLKTSDPKSGDNQLRKIMTQIETLAKKNNCTFLEEKN